MSDLVQIDLELSEPQFHKLKSGKPIQLKHEQLGVGPHFLHVHPNTAKKVHHAKRNKKGVRVGLTAHEFEKTMEAGGFMDFVNKIKKGAEFVKNKIIDSDFYQKNLRGAAKELVNKGIDTFVPEPARQIAHQGADLIGQKTGAFGLKHHVKKRGAPKKRAAKIFTPKPANEARAEFIAESLLAPVPGQAGFTALPQAETGGGVGAQAYHHHHYYPYTAHHGLHGGSFRLA